jgi:hypothetical protein
MKLPLKTAVVLLVLAAACACAAADGAAAQEGEITSDEREFARQFMK